MSCAEKTASSLIPVCVSAFPFSNLQYDRQRWLSCIGQKWRNHSSLSFPVLGSSQPFSIICDDSCRFFLGSPSQGEERLSVPSLLRGLAEMGVGFVKDFSVSVGAIIRFSLSSINLMIYMGWGHQTPSGPAQCPFHILQDSTG